MSVARAFSLAAVAGAVAGAIATLSAFDTHIARVIAADQDPCTLLTAAEAAPYVGPLMSPPYRARDDAGQADVNGEECMYRGKDGRQVTVLPSWSGGKEAGATLQNIPNKIDTASRAKGDTELGTMSHHVLQEVPTGPWDRATWIPGGALFVYKGDAQIRIDVSGASGKQSDAVAMARLIVPRIGHALAYDGAKAVALAPKPKAHPAKACDFLPRSAVEAAIGPLTGAPVSDAAGTGCTYLVSTPQGKRAYPVEFVWEGGQKNYNMLAHGMATLGDLGMPTNSAMDTASMPGGAKGMVGDLMKMVGGGGAAGPSSAPGALSTVGVKTDTALVGPWDRASLQHGTQLIAVRNDVFVGMDLQSADYEKAKALLAAICSRL